MTEELSTEKVEGLLRALTEESHNRRAQKIRDGAKVIAVADHEEAMAHPDNGAVFIITGVPRGDDFGKWESTPMSSVLSERVEPSSVYSPPAYEPDARGNAEPTPFQRAQQSDGDRGLAGRQLPGKTR